MLSVLAELPWCSVLWLSVCVCSSWTHSASYWSDPRPSQNPRSSQLRRTWIRGRAFRELTEWPEVERNTSLCIPWFPVLSPSDSSVSSSVRSCGCIESCISDLGGSDWFSKRYDPKQQPVLRNTNNNFDPDALRWWLVRTKNNVTVDVPTRIG